MFRTRDWAYLWNQVFETDLIEQELLEMLSWTGISSNWNAHYDLSDFAETIVRLLSLSYFKTMMKPLPSSLEP